MWWWWGVGGGFLNNASCQWSNKDKINPPAERLKPCSDYFHICILVIARLGQSDVQLMRFTHAGWTRVPPGSSAGLALSRRRFGCSRSHFRSSDMNYCASSSSTSIFSVNPCTLCSIIEQQDSHSHAGERCCFPLFPAVEAN